MIRRKGIIFYSNPPFSISLNSLKHPQKFKICLPHTLAMIEGRCITCGRGLAEEGCVQFPCPECGYIIKRCNICRSQAAEYKCPECGFEGP